MQYPNDTSEQPAPQTAEQDWPNDFDIRAEIAEQQEVVRQAPTWRPTPPLTCSEYDF